MPRPSTFNPQVILHRLSINRLASYLDDCDNDLERALDLYAWNAQIAAAFLEDLGRLEVVLRNRFDNALTELVKSAGHSSHWFDQPALFPGRHGEHALDDIAKAKERATKNGRLPVARNEVIAELSFGFWRYLCAERYLTSLWGPALASQFPHHPTLDNAIQIRADVDIRMARLHFLRNRVAHHKPIHRRELANDAAMIFELAQWMCLDTHAWMAGLSRIPDVLASRPA
ncbi:MAG: Abi family protein [bacterium]|nr:Abi family protein [bacterium]